MRVLRQTSILMVVGLTPVLAVAQAPDANWPLDSGVRIRVFSPALGPRYVTGQLVSTGVDTVLLLPTRKSRALAVATPAITRLDVARGTHTQKAKYGLFGGLIGAALGAALASATYHPPKCPGPDWCFDFGPEFATTGGAVLGVVVGCIGGVVIGSHPVDTWVRVAVPRQ